MLVRKQKKNTRNVVLKKNPFLGQNSSVFSKYNKIDLIKIVALLSLVPEKMNNIVRLESISIVPIILS